MTTLVPPEDIERIVGTHRRNLHVARADSETEMVYILHSTHCKAECTDLRHCRFSLALDRGIDLTDWQHYLDRPVFIAIVDQKLVPWAALDGNPVV